MRRELRFKTLEDALAELDRLEQGPVTTLGNWSFFQILDHCAGAFRLSMSGQSSPAPGFKKRLLGWAIKHVTFFRGFVPAGVLNPRMSPARVEGDARESAARLREAIATFRTYTGPITPHPFFGPLTKKEWERILIYHMANHLGFVRSEP